MVVQLGLKLVSLAAQLLYIGMALAIDHLCLFEFCLGFSQFLLQILYDRISMNFRQSIEVFAVYVTQLGSQLDSISLGLTLLTAQLGHPFRKRTLTFVNICNPGLLLKGG